MLLRAPKIHAVCCVFQSMQCGVSSSNVLVKMEVKVLFDFVFLSVLTQEVV